MPRGSDRLLQIKTAYVWANPRNCNACWRCIAACPEGVIGKAGFLWHKHIVMENAQACTGCKKCVRICPRAVFSENLPDLLRNAL
ncbi:MAG: 4Fe-4S binding protein [Gracilibacteraceae bacterium]|nr:4Fe-4S binding protein [Gracilibacteraceae bacterium]